MIGRNTYIGDPLYSFDLRLSRYFEFREHMRLDLAVDAFNVFNRPNVDEVNYDLRFARFLRSLGDSKHYNDATTRAIQQGSASVSCAAQQAAAAPPAWLALGLLPVSVPASPNGYFRIAENHAQSAAVAVFGEVQILAGCGFGQRAWMGTVLWRAEASTDAATLTVPIPSSDSAAATPSSAAFR